MITYRRAVRFEEIDAARIVFFAHFASYLHEAMEHFFAGLPGGYVAYTESDRCFSTVKLDSEFLSPLRYGNVVDIEVSATRLGNRSATLHYRFVRDDGVVCATFEHTIVSMWIRAVQSVDMTPEVRALITAHLAA